MGIIVLDKCNGVYYHVVTREFYSIIEVKFVEDLSCVKLVLLSSH